MRPGVACRGSLVPYHHPTFGRKRTRMLLMFIGIGLAAGVLAGLFGVGGGALIVPALLYFAKMPIKMATGTSLGAMLLPVGLLGAWAYYEAGNLDWRASLLIAVGLFFGAFVGAKLTQSMSPQLLQRLFAVFLLLMAVRVWMKA
ncbi:MAG: sulfite exporter TauE/SafE family protein [Gemmatimonadales bacterium]